MKILVEKVKKNNFYNADGLILPLKDFSVQSVNYYTLDEIKLIKEENSNLEIFVSINKNFSNNEIEKLKSVLIQLDLIGIEGIFFYDLAVLQLHRELSLKTNLVWAATYMVNNYKTCNYYYKAGVKYALVSKEITFEEIKEIINNTKSKVMVEVVGLPSVAFSKRKLVTNYYNDLGYIGKDSIEVLEKVTKDNYIFNENNDGTSIYLDKLVNGTSLIKSLYEVGCSYIILREYGIEEEVFMELVEDTKEYILGNCNDGSYVTKYKKLGDFSNFFFKKTIYRVKKNG